MAEKKYYKVNNKTKTISIDASVTPTPEEKEFVTTLIAGGYKPVRKSATKSIKATARASEDKAITKAVVTEWAKENGREAELKTIMTGRGEGHGWFAAKSWYKAETAKKKTTK